MEHGGHNGQDVLQRSEYCSKQDKKGSEAVGWVYEAGTVSRRVLEAVEAYKRAHPAAHIFPICAVPAADTSDEYDLTRPRESFFYGTGAHVITVQKKDAATTVDGDGRRPATGHDMVLLLNAHDDPPHALAACTLACLGSIALSLQDVL